MASFCTKCGARLNEGQGFCSGCGAATGASSAAQPSAPAPSAPTTSATAVPPAAAPPVFAPVAAPAAPASSGGSTLAKILIAIVAVFVLLGAIGIASVVYIGYRVKKKAHEIGINSATFEQHAPTMRGVNACRLLPKEDVSQAIGIEIVRAEAATGSDPGCVYSVKGDAADMTAKHAALMQKNQTSKSDQDTIENFAKGIFHAQAQQDSSMSDHPGETPAFAFGIDENNAQLQMRLNKGTLGTLGPFALSTIPDLGDEAFDVAGAMLFVRKGDKLVRIMYMTCPCHRDDVLPLARKIVDNLNP